MAFADLLGYSLHPFRLELGAKDGRHAPRVQRHNLNDVAVFQGVADEVNVSEVEEVDDQDVSERDQENAGADDETPAMPTVEGRSLGSIFAQKLATVRDPDLGVGLFLVVGHVYGIFCSIKFGFSAL